MEPLIHVYMVLPLFIAPGCHGWEAALTCEEAQGGPLKVMGRIGSLTCQVQPAPGSHAAPAGTNDT